MTRQTFKTNYLKTIDWFNGDIVDWASAGQLYSADGQQRQIAKYHYVKAEGVSQTVSIV
jgi:hypothetical protein